MRILRSALVAGGTIFDEVTDLAFDLGDDDATIDASTTTATGEKTDKTGKGNNSVAP